MFAPILIASILAFASLPSPTHADDQRSTDTAACKSARLSAWFERQRELTDGDTNPSSSRSAGRMQALPK
jgi:hypothetical protein